MSEVADWGALSSGEPVQCVTLDNGVLRAKVVTFGATIRDLRVAGHDAPVVLGFDDIAAYEKHGMYFGAAVGRFANRIAGGRFELDGRVHTLNANEHGNTLHGGAGGFSQRVWAIEDATSESVTLVLHSTDGDMGFPGALTARCTYALDGKAFTTTLTAETNAPTVCSMAQHSYFNLATGGARSIDGHELRVDADAYLMTDARSLPAGAPDGVAATPFDLRDGRPIDGIGFDHNWCLDQSRTPMRNVSRLSAPKAAITMDVDTTEPGLQVYTGDAIPRGTRGLDGIGYGARSGIAVEAQAWPDAPNRPDFPSAVLRPGQRYEQITRWRFSKG